MAAHISEGKQRELGFAAQRIDSNYPLEAPLVVHIWLKNSCTKEFKIPQRYRDAGAFSWVREWRRVGCSKWDGKVGVSG